MFGECVLARDKPMAAEAAAALRSSNRGLN
jgi:hypothetical protein